MIKIYQQVWTTYLLIQQLFFSALNGVLLFQIFVNKTCAQRIESKFL